MAGLQFASLVEGAVSSVASELVFLLNGKTMASCLARDALKEAVYTHPIKIHNNLGLISKAMSFLAGYGIYVTLSTNRFVARMLDVHAQTRKVSGPPLIGPLNFNFFRRGQEYCRIGYLANTFRIAIKDSKG